MTEAPEGRPPAPLGALLRRLPLLVVVLALAWVFLGDRPRELVLEYDLPDDERPVKAQVLIRAPGGDTPGALSWGDGRSRVSEPQPHRVFLRPGTYRVVATFDYEDGTRREVEREVEVSASDERIRLHLSP